MDNGKDAIFLHKLDARFIYVNDAACHSLDYSRDELIGMTVHDIDPKFPKEVWPAHLKEIKKEGFMTIQSHHRRKDGTLFPVEIALRHLEFEGTEYGIAFVRDITERKQAEEALQKAHDELERRVVERTAELVEANEKYKTLFRYSGDGILVADIKNLEFIEANPAICKMLGYSRKELLTKTLKDIHPVESLEVVIDEFNALVKGEQLLTQNIPCLKRQGTIFFTDISSGKAKIMGRDCNIGFFRDATGRRKLEAQLRQTHKMEALGALAGGIAHDFNNILAVIMGNTDMAMSELPEGHSAQHCLEGIMNASFRARDLVKHILAYSRATEKKFTTIQIALIIEESLQFLRSSIPTSIEIRRHINENCGPVSGDPTQIHQVILNLCTNAQLSMEDKGGILEVTLDEVEISANDLAEENIKRLEVQSDAVALSSEILTAEAELKPGKYIKLSVSDTGCGISPEIVEKICDPYFTTRAPGKGSGMGLAIVHGIVKQHGGFLTMESCLGKGTTFDVYFPVAAEGKEEQETTGKEEPVIGGTERILFIDDENTLVDIGKKLLESVGYSVTGVTDSLKALEMFQEAPYHFDLVITDQTMPHMNGSELSEKLLEINPEIPILLYSGHSDQIEDLKREEAGIKGFFAKPFVRKDLYALIRKILDEG